MIARINDKPERALRKAMTSAARTEVNQIESAFAGLDDRERAEALGLAIIITCYVMVDVCGNKWPTQANVRQIARGLATGTTAAERMHLDAEKIYEYLWRVVAGPERLEDVIPDEPEFTRLPLIVMEQALVVFSPKEMSAWDYLDQVETGIEVASALDSWVIPAAVMRGYMTEPKAEGKTSSA